MRTTLFNGPGERSKSGCSRTRSSGAWIRRTPRETTAPYLITIQCTYPGCGERETVERTGKAKRTTWRSMYSSRNIFRSFVHRVYLEPWLLPISLGDDACISSTEQSRPWSVASFRVFAVVQKVTCSTLLRSTQDSIAIFPLSGYSVQYEGRRLRALLALGKPVQNYPYADV